MVHSLAPPVASIPAHTISARTQWRCSLSPPGTDKSGNASQSKNSRRTLIHSLVSVGLGASICCQNAKAAGRRPPPPPPTERKDPNVGGVQAKVLASIKRKEAMKEAIAKLRDKGKTIDGASPE